PRRRARDWRRRARRRPGVGRARPRRLGRLGVGETGGARGLFRRRCAGDRRGTAGGHGRSMIVLSGASLVLPDRILSPGTLTIEDGRIAEIRPDAPSTSHPHSQFAFHGHYIVPGFIDVHVQGIEGIDSRDAPGGTGEDPIASIAARLPRYGVTAFCPTTVACGPQALR